MSLQNPVINGMKNPSKWMLKVSCYVTRISQILLFTVYWRFHGVLEFPTLTTRPVMQKVTFQSKKHSWVAKHAGAILGVLGH